MFKTYNYYKSEETQEKIKNLKHFFTRQKTDLKEGIVKYRRLAFWWSADGDKFMGKSRFRRFWNFRKAYKEGVIDLYMTTILIVGGLTILIGAYRGRKKSKDMSYQEKVN